MIVTRSIDVVTLLKRSGHYILWLSFFVGGVACLYHVNIFSITIPWLPISVIGTAVAFYVGFKNSQAYDRMWEARKVWGAIVNDSRTWGIMVTSFVSTIFSDKAIAEPEIQRIKRRLIYRHIGWLYAHRSQLLLPAPWEHVSQGGFLGRTARYSQKRFGIGLVDDEITRTELTHYLSDTDYEGVLNASNTATQIIGRQSQDIAKLRELNLIDDYRHMALMDVLKSMYESQGKNERIKKFPLPRQYANMSRYFIGIFIFLLPFSMIPELMKLDEHGIWLAIPITVVIGWIYVMMEVVGDYTENPFQGMANDIPMLSLCRTIEIDLKEMLEETDIPSPIKPKNGVLM